MNYIEKLDNFATDFTFNVFERKELKHILIKILNSNKANLFEEIIKKYQVEKFIQVEDFKLKVIDISNSICENKEKVFLLVYIFLILELKEIYIYKQFENDMFLGVANDLKAKMNECKIVKGYCGIFAENWFEKFLNLENFAIGRLQFNFKYMPVEYKKNNIVISKGDKVIAIHIPSGKPLDEVAVRYSIERAKKFFASKMCIKNANFICKTYLFHPSMVNLYKENSNLEKFYRLFDVFYIEEDLTNKDAWRIFNCESDNFSVFPENTSLQRGLKHYLQCGGNMGIGIGVLK